MNRHFRRTLGGALLLAVFGCGDEDLLFRGGPPREAASIDISSAATGVRVGQSFDVGVQIRDGSGNPLDQTATLTSSSSALTVASGAVSDNFNATFTVTGAALGTATLTAAGAGLSDSVTVEVGPQGMAIQGPDSVGSGNAATFTVNTFNAAGTQLSGTVPSLEWTSGNTSRLAVDFASGAVVGQGTGSVGVQVRAPGGASALKTITVAPGVFGGTLSATTGAASGLVTATRASEGPVFDDDVVVIYGGEQVQFLESRVLDAIVIPIPTTGSTGAQTMVFRNLGPGQFEQNTTFTSTSAAFQDGQTGSDLGATAPNVSAVISSNGNIYLAHAGFGTGSASRGFWNGGTQRDHYFRITTGAAAVTITVTLEWPDGSDVDLGICDVLGAGCIAVGFSGSSSNEVLSDITIPANSTFYIVASMWSAGSNITNMRMNVVGLP